MDLRIGNGYDIHALAVGETLWLGGLQIEHEKGTVAHSDGDVLIHAICDALLGALSLGDIGKHFPDTDPAYKNIDSKQLLANCNQLINNKGYQIVNIDSTICAQHPKLRDHIDGMRKCLATILKIETHQISIKATTTEKLGFIGREEGISSYAVVLIKKVLF
ncbi:MAG: 2-C-methyl-D-erythritol 2,4-cyclodiphosphate synthase [Prolixibacteraceae bacterium]|jgi:2-C-methyl-D-erythritol 2,4-cyclodiphosphate synthase|nr:2-C-methyl-D-erythritol 2,4-cyclodiphosphate synthase [Prolixibacteraceae bacterium]